MIHFLRFLFSRIFLINLSIAILLIVSALYGVLEYLDRYTLHDKTIEIPSLINHRYEDLDTLLGKEGDFTVKVIDSIYQEGVGPGIIIDQNPTPYSVVKQGRKIYLTISATDPPRITMPNLVDMSLRQASSLLETFNLKVGSLIYRPDLCVNCILAQELDGLELPEGSKVPLGSSIDLIVGEGLGDELVGVPYLIELNLDFAEELLRSKSLNVGTLLPDETIKTANDSLNARIYKQIPKYQEKPSVRMGSSVDLFLTIDSNKIRHTLNPTDTL